MQKLGGFSKSPPFLLFSFALSSALLPPSAPLLPRLHSLFSRTPPPVPQLRACTCALPRALAHTRASADFRFLPSPFTALSQLTVYQHTRGEHLPHIIPFTLPSPSLSRFSPTGYGKVPLFPTLPPYFSRHSPYLANCKISHRAGEGIFLKAFTPYALIYCALRPTGEEVKEKNENLLTRARERARKEVMLQRLSSSLCVSTTNLFQRRPDIRTLLPDLRKNLLACFINEKRHTFLFFIFVSQPIELSLVEIRNLKRICFAND